MRSESIDERTNPWKPSPAAKDGASQRRREVRTEVDRELTGISVGEDPGWRSDSVEREVADAGGKRSQRRGERNGEEK